MLPPIGVLGPARGLGRLRRERRARPLPGLVRLVAREPGDERLADIRLAGRVNIPAQRGVLLKIVEARIERLHFAEHRERAMEEDRHRDALPRRSGAELTEGRVGALARL